VAGVGGFDPNTHLMEDADFNALVMRKCGAIDFCTLTLFTRAMRIAKF
jgi:hypothetical protein